MPWLMLHGQIWAHLCNFRQFRTVKLIMMVVLLDGILETMKLLLEIFLHYNLLGHEKVKHKYVWFLNDERLSIHVWHWVSEEFNSLSNRILFHYMWALIMVNTCFRTYGGCIHVRVGSFIGNEKNHPPIANWNFWFQGENFQK